MRIVLAATDFSVRAAPAVRRAALLATKHSAAIVLCHVVDDDQIEGMQTVAADEALRMLEAMQQGVPELANAKSSLSVAKGAPFEAILNAGDTAGADLIVIGSHRRSLLRDVFTGTTAERVIRRGSRPVLMVNKPPAAPYRRVLVAVDLSAASAHALEVARRLGLFAGAHVLVFHAFDAMLSSLGTANISEDKIQQHLADASSTAKRDVEAFLEDMALADVSYSIVVREGRPVTAIKNAVEELGADLVVLGTRGRTGGIAKFVLGSVAEEAIRELEVDILAVPPTQG